MDADMRRIEIEEVEDAKTKANNFGGIIRLEALDSRTGTCGACANPNTNLNGSLSEEDRQAKGHPGVVAACPDELVP
ncbi:hypothetical protein JHK87_044921 [Glycine soja]|nr:hypothetical protein JHK87_044921 [Glycine soja]